MYKRIRDLREDADLTQKEIAKMIGISQRGYSHYETGNNDIPTEILIKLAQIYETSTDYILGLSTKRYNEKKTKSHICEIFIRSITLMDIYYFLLIY